MFPWRSSPSPVTCWKTWRASTGCVRALDSPGPLGLTLDIGHCQCLEPSPPADCVREAAPWLRHVQMEDMCRGTHEHLPFGTGEIDFPPVFQALREVAYTGLVSVELPRDSHAGPARATESLAFLTAASGTPLGNAPSATAPSASAASAAAPATAVPATDAAAPTSPKEPRRE